MLSQVIYNLIDNALRYTAEGTPIEIAAWRTDETVIVSVADQGSDLEPGEFGKVFDRLETNDSSPAQGVVAKSNS